MGRTVADFHARVVQHECDHLAGNLYPMRIRDLPISASTRTCFPGGRISGTSEEGCQEP